MKSLGIPCCFHPTTVVAVDDDPVLLKQLVLNYGDVSLSKNFMNPGDAIDFFQQYQAQNFTQCCVLRGTGDDFEQGGVTVNIQKIHEHIYNPQPF